MSMRRIAVIGAGLAGLRSVEQLRSGGFDGTITLVGDERHAPYNRPPLSKQLLAGDMDADELLFDCDDLDVDLVLGHAAVSLDRERRQVALDGADPVDYDALVIATGRRAREWPELPDLEGFFMLRSLDDALALREAIDAAPRVVIVGAGFIGCEVAATLRKRGLDHVSLVDIAPHPMPALGEEIGQRAARMHEEQGVKLYLDQSVDAFVGDGRVEGVCLASGERLDADLVLIALGSIANTEWLADSGLELHKGSVLCDEQCFAVGTDDIVAVGDVAAWPHPAADGPIWIEHWTNAAEMARHAAKNLLAAPDERTPFVPVPTFWSDQYDTKIKSAGLFGLVNQVSIVEENLEDWKLIAEGHADGELIGAVTFNSNKSFINYKRDLSSALQGQDRA